MAMDENRAIGFENQLLFHLSADLKRFKQLTTGHTVLMGRKTFESLPKGALPNRRNVVLSTRSGLTFENAEVFGSLSDALEATATDEVFIIGGAKVYEQAIGLADRLCVTEVKAKSDRADAYFPTIDQTKWKEVSREHHEADEKNAYPFDFVDYELIPG